MGPVLPFPPSCPSCPAISNHLILLLAATAACFLGAPASAQERLIDVERSTVTVRVFKSGLFRPFADDHTIQAPLAEGTFEDTAPPHVQIVIDSRQMRVLDP